MDSGRKGSIVRARKLRNQSVGATGKKGAGGPSSSGDDTAQHRKHLAQLEAHRRRAIENWLRRRRRRRAQRMMDECTARLSESLRAKLAQAQGHREATRAAVVYSCLLIAQAAVAATELVVTGSDDTSEDDDDENADAASGDEDREMDDGQAVSERGNAFVPESK
ncbi:hypothetical protein DL765_003390 [Monosporascus sp. GIB2]|nr:hypothetical protein DL765_003390 [Monosporascus sp. GIB2]